MTLFFPHYFKLIQLLIPDFRFSGLISGGATPVPIPNTEVKPFSADGTARAAVWESRTRPDSLFNRHQLIISRWRFFLFNFSPLQKLSTVFISPLRFCYLTFYARTKTKLFPLKKTTLPPLQIIHNFNAFSLTISTGLVTIALLFTRDLSSSLKDI